MQREAPGALLDAEQQRMAEQGLKALIPFHGHPFLSYGISALADAGVRDVCLVVRPGADPIRAYYEGLTTERVRLSFAVQPEPLGTADALLAAEPFAAGRDALVLNGDNLYPSATLEQLAATPGSSLAAFDAEALVSKGNIPAERIAAYALVTTDAEGCLEGIVEKPGAEELRRLAGGARVSMTCWRFTPSIFEACRAIAPSPRGELELPDAVLHAARQLGERFRAFPSEEPVLDLSTREDIAALARHLEGREVRL